MAHSPLHSNEASESYLEPSQPANFAANSKFESNFGWSNNYVCDYSQLVLLSKYSVFVIFHLISFYLIALNYYIK